MPWCEDCSKYWAPSAMTPEGGCPTCGRDLETPEPKPDAESETRDRAPWHFKLMIVALVVYLVWRFYEIFT
jgi:hypothetical protein